MANCCGQSNQSTPGAQPAAMAPAFNVADVPDTMVLIEYTGTNTGSTLWGGPGATPSRRQYVFGANDSDQVKYVDQVDVDFFLNLREYAKPVFKRYEAPAQAPAPAPELAPPAGDEGDPKVDNLQESDGENNAMLAPDEGDQAAPDGQQTQVVDPGNITDAPADTTAKVADPLTVSIVDPDKPTVTEEVKEEPAPEVAPQVAPKSHKAGKK